jgi:hypothetical protein
LIIISDFIGLKGGWEKYFNLIASKVGTLVIMIRDPVDNYIPNNIKNVIISDPYSQKQILINTESFRKKYNKEVINYDSKIKRFFKKSEIDVIELTTNKPFTKEIIKFFYERK